MSIVHLYIAIPTRPSYVLFKNIMCYLLSDMRAKHIFKMLTRVSYWHILRLRYKGRMTVLLSIILNITTIYHNII